VDGSAQDVNKKSIGYRFWKGGGQASVLRFMEYAAISGVRTILFSCGHSSPYGCVATDAVKRVSRELLHLTWDLKTSTSPRSRVLLVLGDKEIDGGKEGASISFDQPATYQVKPEPRASA
jgi:hypothetical protein